MGSTSRWQAERAVVLGAARQLVQRGLVVGTSGNVSLRLPREDGRDTVIITPTSRYYDSLTVEDIPAVDLDSNLIEGVHAPSSESLLHTYIYRARTDVHAVVHTHSTFASAVAVAGVDIPPILEEEVALVGGEIKVSRYARAGSVELARNAVEALGERNAVILANHGAVGVGRTMRDAMTVCELLEKTATIYLHVLAVGKVNALSPEGLAAARELFIRLQSKQH